MGWGLGAVELRANFFDFFDIFDPFTGPKMLTHPLLHTLSKLSTLWRNKSPQPPAHSP
jgi:hypothetical protein